MALTPRFPGAFCEYWHELPPDCPRCHGPLKPVNEGVACMLCSRILVVEQAMRLAMNMGRWESKSEPDDDDTNPLEPPKRTGIQARLMSGRLKRVKGID